MKNEKDANKRLVCADRNKARKVQRIMTWMNSNSKGRTVLIARPQFIGAIGNK